jgi:uncharacterized protein YciI
MVFIQLKFSDNKVLAKDYMAEHNAWLQKAFDEGVFLLSGSLKGGAGGVILANVSGSELDARIASDPFIEHGIVAAEIIEFSVGKHQASLTAALEGEIDG